MQLFYSGSSAPLRAQPDPASSLGGFISTTSLRNGTDGNIFPSITSDQVSNNYPDVRLIVLTNTTGATVTDINIYTIRGTLATYKLGAVAPAVDSCKNKVFEKIYDGRSLPFQTVLETAEGVGEAIVIDTLAVGDSIGIWIERDLDLTQFTALDGNTTGITPFDQFDQSPLTDPAGHGCALLVKQLQDAITAGTVNEQFSLVISWS